MSRYILWLTVLEIVEFYSHLLLEKEYQKKIFLSCVVYKINLRHCYHKRLGTSRIQEQRG